MGPPAVGLALALAAGQFGSAPIVTTAEAAVAEGDAYYARRAEGARGGVGDPAMIDAAISDYRRGLVLDPESIPARIGLLRALFFRGGFCNEAGDKREATFAEAKRLADESMQRLEARVDALHAASRLAALRQIPGAAALMFWSAVSWGQWSLDHKLAAAWHGAASRIRDLSETAVALEPGYEEGSPYMVLGRLHVESPKIVFLTSWVSRKKGLESLRRAYTIAPANSAAQYMLADAILNLDTANRAEALRILETCAAQEPRVEYLVEDRHYAEMARERLQDPSARD